MHKRLAWVEEVIGGMGEALRRFPFTLLASWVAVIAFWIQLELESESVEHYLALQIGLTALFGLPLFTAARLLGEAFPGRGTLLTIAGALATCGIWFLVPALALDDWTGAEMLRYGLLLLWVHLAVSVLPAVSRDADWFWTFNFRLFLRFIIGAFFMAVLFGASCAALGSAMKLFDFEVKDVRWMQMWVFFTFGVQTFFLLPGVPGLRPEAGWSREELPIWLGRFARFVLGPVVVLYFLILYAYAVKIAATGNWPDGWVALPVLVLAGCGGLVAVLLRPYVREGGPAWAAWFWRLFFPLLLPLSFLLFFAVAERVDAYGITPARYGGWAIAVWLWVICGLFLFRKCWHLVLVPASLLVFVGAAAVGPLSATATSLRSQRAQLMEVAEALGALRDGRLAPNPGTAPDSQVQRLRSIVSTLIEWNGAPALAGVLPVDGGPAEPEEGSRGSSYARTERFMEWIALRGDGSDGQARWIYLNAPRTLALPVTGAVAETHYWSPTAPPFGTVDNALQLADGSRLVWTADNAPAIELHSAGSVLRIRELDTFLEGIVPAGGNTIPAGASFTAEAGADRFTFQLIQLSGNRSGDKFTVSSIAFLVWREK